MKFATPERQSLLAILQRKKPHWDVQEPQLAWIHFKSCAMHCVDPGRDLQVVILKSRSQSEAEGGRDLIEKKWSLQQLDACNYCMLRRCLILLWLCLALPKDGESHLAFYNGPHKTLALKRLLMHLHWEAERCDTELTHRGDTWVAMRELTPPYVSIRTLPASSSLQTCTGNLDRHWMLASQSTIFAWWLEMSLEYR